MRNPTPSQNTSGLAWSPQNAPGAEAAHWWSARVLFNGQPTRRLDMAHALSARPGLTEREVRRLLEAAPLAAGPTAPDPALRPLWFWDAKVFFNGKPTTRHEAKAVLEAPHVPAGYLPWFVDTVDEPWCRLRLREQRARRTGSLFVA